MFGKLNSFMAFYEGDTLKGANDDFVLKGKGLGIEVEHPTGHHGFDIKNNDDTSRAIILQSIDFIKNHFNK
ncbi:hypothetical protein [Alkaliphilus serpentinus]|uniref:Uncharacterized protein n=1 Tax=Alkaliphilus serpentinus TaxID=1482731 RepID=A0A833HR70_9FIRM|nr:hypothetical protein [Alkaliphilus serpentinus]KAB3531566.1 hypothetical protein F8153_05165 [Alkaliphilus serpentinus]